MKTESATAAPPKPSPVEARYHMIAPGGEKVFVFYDRKGRAWGYMERPNMVRVGPCSSREGAVEDALDVAGMLPQR